MNRSGKRLRYVAHCHCGRHIDILSFFSFRRIASRVGGSTSGGHVPRCGCPTGWRRCQRMAPRFSASPPTAAPSHRARTWGHSAHAHTAPESTHMSQLDDITWRCFTTHCHRDAACLKHVDGSASHVTQTIPGFPPPRVHSMGLLRTPCPQMSRHCTGIQGDHRRAHCLCSTRSLLEEMARPTQGRY